MTKGKTIEEAQEKLIELGVQDIVINKLTKYKFEIQCNLCKNLYYRSYTYIENNQLCSCHTQQKLLKKNASEKFEKIANDRGDKILKYNGTTKYMDIKCGICNNEYSMRPDTYQNTDIPCLICKQLHKEYKIQRIMNKYGDMLVEYTGTKNKMKVKCRNEHTYDMLLSHYRRGDMCPGCKENSKNNELEREYIRMKNRIENCGHILKSKRYKGYNGYIKIICPANHKYKSQIYRFDNGQRCRECAILNTADIVRLKYDEVVNRIKERGDELISKEYVHCNNPLEIKCGDCQNIFVKTLSKYMNSAGCNKCRCMSTGEKLIMQYLDKHNIRYDMQKTFEGCKNERLLRFDFHFIDYNANGEFNGKQHYEPIEHFGGLETFLETQKRDNIKKKFCLDNKIKLLEISYKNKKDIAKILNNVFLSFIISNEYYFEGSQELEKYKELY